MKLLLAVDGSTFSDAATAAVISQVRPEGSEILVLRVVETRGPEMDAPPKEHFTRAQESVDHAAQALRKAGFKVVTRVFEGEARNGILDVAAELRSDLIVVGSHGRSGLGRLLLGSVAESVARHAHCSVLIVRASS